MFARTGWVNRKWQSILGASNPVPSAALPIIHEDSLQAIQGGLPGEHFHLSASELANVQHYIEPAIIICEPLFDSYGNIVMMRV